jgi:hypothetical protein
MHLRDKIRARLTGILVFLVAFAPAARAGLQDDLNARWRGAWLIVTGDISSNCNGLTTDNRISGDLVSTSGRFIFEPGELARVEKIDAKRNRVDVIVDLRENVLIAYQDGPFTLYREGACKVELEVDFGSRRAKDVGIAGIEAQFAEWFERHARLDDALASASYNHRVREDFPADYDSTLIAYENWKIDEHNRLVADRIADSTEQTSLLLAHVDSDKEFGAGLGSGIASMREAMTDECGRLISSSPATFAESVDAPNEDWADGYKTGQELAYHIELSRRLSRCFIATDESVAYLD